MSGTNYRSFTPIRFAELFDGRLEDAGVYEHPRKSERDPNGKCLTDGDNVVWVYPNEEGVVTTFMTFGSNDPRWIFQAIADKLDVEIVSEHEPQYWGFETDEEWEAAWKAEAEKDEHDFYEQVIKFVRGDSHGIESGTIGMKKAEIAKRLTARAPHLLAENRRRELIKAVEEVYGWDYSEIGFEYLH